MTAAEVSFHPAAAQELLEAADFYDLESPSLGAAFLDAVESALAGVAELPASCPIALGNVRKLVVARFPYSVMYSAGDAGIVVSAVAHHRRRPLYWQHRA